MEANEEKIGMIANNSDNFAEKSGNIYKGRRELITDYWCQKKKEARIAGREYTDIDQETDVAKARILYPFEGRYVIDAEGNVQPLKQM
jgi:hypothetical protein